MPDRRLAVLKALGDNTRYAIYLELARSSVPLTTADVAESLDLHPNTVRPHLERMRDVGLLTVAAPYGQRIDQRTRRLIEQTVSVLAVALQLAQVNEGDIGLIKNLGKELFSTYVVPFEISSILFLSAMVGAVVIGKKE